MNPIASRTFSASDPRMSDAASLRPANQPSSDRSSKFEVVRKQVRTAQNSDPDASLQRTEALMDRETWEANRVKLDQAVQRASALPQTSAVDAVRLRLADLDSQHQRLELALDGISRSASPDQLLKLQRDMYQVSENIGWISKTIDQLTSGVKSLLQTQI